MWTEPSIDEIQSDGDQQRSEEVERGPRNARVQFRGAPVESSRRQVSGLHDMSSPAKTKQFINYFILSRIYHPILCIILDGILIPVCTLI